MALFNIHEDYWDRPLEGNDDENHIPRFWARVLSGLFSFVCKVFFRFRVENQDIIRAFKGKTTGAVIVSPHVSYFDVVAMFVSVRPGQWVRLMGRDTLFAAAGGWLGTVISHAGAFPVKRNTADLAALKRAARMLKNGELVGVFPEGTRRGKGTGANAIHGGAALVARMGKAPLVPLGLENLDKVKPKGKLLGFPRITARFGTPVALSSFDFLPKEERLDACSWYVLRESFALSRNVKPEEVDMVVLFPESKDYTAVFAEHRIEPFDPSSLKDYEPKN